MTEEQKTELTIEQGVVVTDAIADLPAPFINHAQVIVNGGFTRIVLGETFGGLEPRYRSSVMMPTAVARALGKLIEDTIRTNEQASEKGK